MVEQHRMQNPNQSRLKYVLCKHFILFLMLISSFLMFVNGFTICSSPSLSTLKIANTNIEQKITTGIKSIENNSYSIADNTGYNISIGDKSSPFSKSYAQVYLKTTFAEIVDTNTTMNSYPAYGYKTTDESSDRDASAKIELLLKYNYNNKTNIDGTKWGISNDSWKNGINGIGGVGVVNSGALLIQKSYNGIDWFWENQYSTEKTQSLHTVDFINVYSPEQYSKDYLTIYQPSGHDLNQGVYLRTLFAYELSYYSYDNGWNSFFNVKTWHYKNIVEETTFYISNSNAEILFQNLNFSAAGITEDEDGVSQAFRQFGTLNNGDAANDAFKVNFNSNKSYKINYSYNGSTNINSTPVVDGQVFTQPGKYVFKVTPKVGEPKYYTIYINERGLQQNLNLYFGDNLITSDSKRVFSQSDTVPVYLAGAKWQTKQIDENHMPVVGRIGKFEKTVTKLEYEALEKDESMFALETQIEVDENYIPQDNDGYEKNTFEDGTTIYTISGYNIYSLVAEKEDSNKAEWGSLNEPGYYVGQFANNPKYFDNSFTGDVYSFIFQFKIVDEGTTPQINQSLFEGNIDVSAYGSSYYGVTIPCVNTVNTVTYACLDYESAYVIAYKYVRSLVKNIDGKYVLEGKEYTSQNELSQVIDAKTKSLINIKYFDVSNPCTYLTLANKSSDILEIDLPYDVVVFDRSIDTYEKVVGLPYLNDRHFYVLDDNNEKILKTEPVKFIQVAPYESSSVIIKSVVGNFEYEIPYNTPVQSYLEARNAETGKYLIIEKNEFGATEYYANYIKPGDNKIKIETTRTVGEFVQKQNLSINEAASRFTVSSFILNSASNELDGEGLVKVTKVGSETNIYSIKEIKDLIIDQQGSYVIKCVDRLGNTYEFYVDIYNPSKVTSLTLKNNDTVCSTELVAGGTRVYLPNPEIENNDLVFVGWQDSSGNVHKDSFIYNYSEDTVLTAIWHYKNVLISIYDGKKIFEDSNSVGQNVVLPSVTKLGYDLFGFAEKESNNKYKFHYGEITSVPNVQNLKLDVVWIDRNDSIQVVQGDSLPERNKDGLIFFGWVTGELEGRIYNDFVDIADDELTLYPLYLSGNQETTPAGVAGWLRDTGNVITTMGAFVVNNAVQISFMVLLLSLIILGLIFIRKYQSKLALNVSVLNNDSQLDNSLKSQTVCFDTNAEIKIEEKINNPKVKNKILPKFSYRNWIAPIICVFMMVILAFNTNYPSIFTFQSVYQKHETETSIKREFENCKTELESKKLEIELAEQKQDEYFEKATELYQSVADCSLTTNETEYLDENTNLVVDYYNFSQSEEFLYDLILLDLLDLGYEVFFANIVCNNGKTVRGFVYTDFVEIQTDGDLDLYKAGFIEVLGEPHLTDEDLAAGIVINIIEDLFIITPEDLGYTFNLEYNLELPKKHYIAYGEYCQYSIKDHIICDYLPVAYTENLVDPTLGVLYDYDLERIVYDPYLGEAFDESGYSIAAGVDYEYALEIFNTIIENQNSNATTVDTMSVTAVSVSAINEYILHNQNEDFLGIPAQQLQFIEANLANNIYYYVDENGEVQYLEIPQDQIKKGVSVWQVLSLVLNTVQIGVGIVLICTGVGAGLGGSLITSGAIGLVGDIIGFFDNERLTQVFNGSNSIADGGTAIAVGRKLCGKGKIATTIGIISMLIGAGTIVFGSAELTEGAFDYNFMKEWTNMSDEVFDGIYLGLNIGSTVVTIVGSTMLIHHKNSLRNVELSQVKQAEIEKAVNSLPGKNNSSGWSLARDPEGNIPITKAELKANGGNCYVLSKDGTICFPVQNGDVKFTGITEVVTSEMITPSRGKNFPKFDELLAARWSNPTFHDEIPVKYLKYFDDLSDIQKKEIINLRKLEKLTWHEIQNGAVLIQHNIHTPRYGGIPHTGGISKAKDMLKLLGGKS